MEVTNGFKGLDMIDRVPEELWTEVYDIVQEKVIKIILKKNKCKKTKWLSEEALKIDQKRKEDKGNREKESYILLIEIRLIIFFVAKDGEALYSQQKQDRELTVAQIMNTLLPNSDLN